MAAFIYILQRCSRKHGSCECNLEWKIKSEWLVSSLSHISITKSCDEAGEVDDPRLLDFDTEMEVPKGTLSSIPHLNQYR